MARIGVDLGGTKIEAVVLSGAGEILARERTDTPQGDYQKTVQAVVDLVKQVEALAGVSGSVGVGAPGAVSHRTGRLKNANSVCLIDQPLREDLSHHLQRPVRLANDADCFALSEAVDGAAAGAGVVFGVILGTGVGGGVVVNGALLNGPNAIAGEWGHNALPWTGHDEIPGNRCYCGREGCIETFLSGPGMARHYEILTGQRDISSKDIIKAVEQGDVTAMSYMEQYADRLSRALSSVINLIDPHVIVLGGGLSNIDWLYQRVPEVWDAYVFSDQVETRLVKARYGDSSGVRGAAWLWPKGCDDVR
ncbi:MAG: ROK family protein [Magnetococcales bacterium]|nr:ROK family protein [Magnetococcales bacterium]